MRTGASWRTSAPALPPPYPTSDTSNSASRALGEGEIQVNARGWGEVSLTGAPLTEGPGRGRAH